MELTNEFRVPVAIDEAWGVLTDVERIAPCMPGAQLQEVEGDEYRGVVKVKVGPITAQYKGAARFLEQDKDAHRAVLRAEGRETRGQGNANATITATLEPDGDGTSVRVVTDLTVTGRVAQFGRGVMADVSAKLLDQFVDCLEHRVLGGDESEGAATAETEASYSSAQPATAAGADEAPVQPTEADAGPTVRRVESPEAEPVDLFETAGAPVAKRVVPFIVGLLTFAWLVRRIRRRRARKRG
ncbi:MAG: SRPBCC family protein [Acidimicrobiales bacterium]